MSLTAILSILIILVYAVDWTFTIASWLQKRKQDDAGIFATLREKLRAGIGHVASAYTWLREKLRTFLSNYFSNVGIVGAFLVVAGITWLIYRLDPTAGSLPPGTLQLVGFAPLLLFVMIHCATWTYEKFLPKWYEFLKSDEPKLFADVLPDLDKLEVIQKAYPYGIDVKATQTRINYYRTKFLIRCVRTAFSWFPYLVLLYLLLQLVLLSLTLVPR